jgi:hypothetical protein
VTIPELSYVRLRSGQVEGVDRFTAGEDWEPAAGMEGHAHPHVPVYIVGVHPLAGTARKAVRPLALLDVREEDLEVVRTPQR